MLRADHRSSEICERGLAQEEEAVLLCARAERDPVASDRLERLVRAGLNWDLFWSVAARQRVRPLAASVLLGPSLAPLVPADCLRDMRRLRAELALSNSTIYTEMKRLGLALTSGTIPVASLKGVHLANRLYGDPVQREVGDIDLLVPEEDVGPARSVLYHAGYAQLKGVESELSHHRFHEAPFVKAGPVTGFVVELHWKLSDPRFVTIDYGDLWRRVLEGGTDRAGCHQLPAEETLLFLALHVFKHTSGILRLLADIDRLLRNEGDAIDWTYVLALAERWSVSGPLYFALTYAHQLLETPVPVGVLGQSRPGAWKRVFVDRLVGPRTAFRPARSVHLHYSRSLLAYCLMLRSWRRMFDAYILYLYPWPETRHSGGAGSAADFVQRVMSGIAKTALALADALIWPRGDTGRPLMARHRGVPNGREVSAATSKIGAAEPVMDVDLTTPTTCLRSSTTNAGTQ